MREAHVERNVRHLAIVQMSPETIEVIFELRERCDDEIWSGPTWPWSEGVKLVSCHWWLKLGPVRTLESIKIGSISFGSIKIGPIKVAPIQVGPIEVGPIKVEPIKIGPIWIGHIIIGPIRVWPIKFGPIVVGPIENWVDWNWTY